MAPFGLSVFFLVVCFLDFPCGFTQLIGAVWKPHDSHADPVMPFRHLRRSSSRDGNASQSMWTLVEQTNKSIVYNWEAGARACCQKIARWSKYGTIWWKKRRLNENFMKIWETKNSFLFLGQKLRTAHFLGPKSRMCAEICRKKKKRPAAFPSAARSWIQSAQPHVQHVARDESNDASAESPRFVIKKMSRFSRFPMFLILISFLLRFFLMLFFVDLSFTCFTFLESTQRFSLRRSLPKKHPTKSELLEIASEKHAMFYHVFHAVPSILLQISPKNQQTPKPEARLDQQIPLDYQGIVLQVPGRHQRSVGTKTYHTQHGQLKH